MKMKKIAKKMLTKLNFNLKKTQFQQKTNLQKNKQILRKKHNLTKCYKTKNKKKIV